MDNKEKSTATGQANASGKPSLITAHKCNEYICPLCHSSSTGILHRDSHSKIDREYLRCANCDLIFVPNIYHLSPEQEKAIYDCHQNNPNDKGYRNFLSRLSTPLQDYLNTGDKGLDFGCGPGPTLSLMLREAGYDVAEYDPYYTPDETTLQQSYHFITSTEVIEHLSKPKEVFNKLFGLLKPGGILGLMTKRPPKEGIANWHYTKDPTHITFYSEQTFLFIAKKFNCTLEVISDDIVLLIRKS